MWRARSTHGTAPTGCMYADDSWAHVCRRQRTETEDVGIVLHIDIRIVFFLGGRLQSVDLSLLRLTELLQLCQSLVDDALKTLLSYYLCSLLYVLKLARQPPLCRSCCFCRATILS